MAISRRLVLSLAFLSLAPAVDAQTGRPAGLDSSVLQFAGNSAMDGRTMSIFRAGAGAARPAEVTVYELVRGGEVLQRVGRTVLRNGLRPVTWHVPTSRFVVGIDDVEGGIGTTGHCVVIHDLFRGTEHAFALEDFLAQETIDALDHSGTDLFPGTVWQLGSAWYDPEQVVFYPSAPRWCRETGVPFVAVDLRSGTCVHRTEVPAHLPERCIERTPAPFDWTCGFGESGRESEWNVRFAYPTHITGRVLEAGLTPELREFLRERVVLEYRLDPESGDYLLQDDGARSRAK